MAAGYSAGLAAWKLLFQLSPIIFTNGMFGSIPGAMMPIIALTESINFPLGMLSGGEDIELDRFFANYQPLPGSTLIQQDVARYPFANSAVAANSTIRLPTRISLLMICPVQNKFGWFEKLAVITALKAAFEQHNAMGGTYTIATPSAIYTNCLLLNMSDASVGMTKQVQNSYQLDFEKPLLTLEEAASVQNGLMNAITNGGQIDNPAFSGLGAASSGPGSLAGPGIIPAAVPSVPANTIATGPGSIVGNAFNAPTGTLVTGGGSAGSGVGGLGGG